MFKVGIITIPERLEIVKNITTELEKLNIPYKLFIDYDHKGQPYNFTRMLEHFCYANHSNQHIILTTDDILFKEGWLEKIIMVLENTDYEVIGGYSNKIQNVRENIYKGTGKHVLYDQIICYRKGILNPRYFDGFEKYRNDESRTLKERNHYDVMNSHYVRDMGYRICVIRPNIVTQQNVKSSLGHSIKITE